MLRQLVILLFALSCLACASPSAHAATVEVAATIKSIDTKAREITVVYETKSWQKTMQLVVAPKADITVDGKPGTLESLKPDQKATVLFDKELLVATKVEVKGDRTDTGQMSVVEVSELQNVVAPCVSENGRTIYFNKPGKRWHVYSAHRKDTDSLFENERVLFEGMHPAVTNDGLEMILVGSPTPEPTSEQKCFCSTTRDTITDSFRRPKPVLELRDPPDAATWSRNPYLSPDGLTLYFNRYPEEGKIEFAFSTRPDRHSAWSGPQSVPLKGGNLFNAMTCPFVTDDTLTLLCVNEAAPDWMKNKGNFLKFTRSTLGTPFADPQFVEIRGIPQFIGRYPRYVPATKELFFSQRDEDNLGSPRLLIIKNFVP